MNFNIQRPSGTREDGITERVERTHLSSSTVFLLMLSHNLVSRISRACAPSFRPSVRIRLSAITRARVRSMIVPQPVGGAQLFRWPHCRSVREDWNPGQLNKDMFNNVKLNSVSLTHWTMFSFPNYCLDESQLNKSAIWSIEQ